jgi:PAS domain S-box-containing protein
MIFPWRRRSMIAAIAGALAVYVGASVFILSQTQSGWLLLADAAQLAAVFLLGAFLVRQFAVVQRTQTALAAANADLQDAQASLATSNDALRLTRDELKRTRQQLVDGIEGLADGFALYDSDDRLVICNRRYRELYASDSHAPKPGTRFEDMLRNLVTTGRVPSAVGHEEEWVAQRLAQHRDPHGLFERNICGRWYRFSDRPTSDGGTVTIFTPIDELKQREERLRESQAILQSILDHIPVTVSIADRERRVVLINKRVENLYGVKLADAVGRSVAEVRPSRYERGSAAADHARVTETGEPIFGREERFVGDGGEEESWIASVVPIKDPHGSVQYVLRTSMEVPQLARANRELADYRAFLIEAERQAGMTSWYHEVGREDGVIWSENVIAVLGLPPERLDRDADFVALIHPDDRERIAALFREIAERPAGYDTEYRIVRPDGSTAWLRGIAKVQRDAAGEPDRLVGAVQDITGQKRIEEALRESEARLRDAQRRARLAYWLADIGSGGTYIASELMPEVLGLPPEAVPTNDADRLKLVHPEDRNRVAHAYARAMTSRAAYAIEYRIFRGDGSIGWVRELSEVQSDAAGRSTRMIGTVQDITAQKATEEALRASEARMRAFMDNAPAAIAMKDADRRFVMLNSWVESAYGRRAQDLIGRRSVDILPSDGTRALDAMESEVVAGGRTVTREVYFAERTKLPWTHEVRFPIRNSVGEVTAIGGIAIDISDRKRAELGLRESEARLRRAQQQAKLAYWSWQLDTDDYEWAPGSGSILGMPESELPRTGADFYQRLHPDDHGRMRRNYEAVQAGRDTYTAEYRIVRPNGQIVWVEETGEVECDAAGRRVSVAGVIQDVTERKRAEQALRDSEARLRRAQEQARLAYWTWQFAIDRSNEEFRWSPGSGPLLGVADEDMPATEVAAARLMHPDDLDRVRRLYADVRSGLDRYGADYRVIRPDGQTVWVREIGEAVRDADGRRVGVEGTLQDITEQHALEEQLVQSQKMEAIGQLTGGIAHDFNNLLAVILGNLELLGEELPGDAGVRQKIDAALRSTLRGSDLTHRLLAYARRQPLAPTVTQVNELIRNMRELMLRPLGPTIDVAFALGEKLWSTEVDQAQLETSLLNLVINARDAMPEGGRLGIETGNVTVGADSARHDGSLAPGDYVCIAVSDSGSGMSEMVKARAFDPFFTTKGVGQGTGLGLSMVYGFVKQSGGHVELESDLGCGTVVRIYLPRATKAGVTAAAA